MKEIYTVFSRASTPRQVGVAVEVSVPEGFSLRDAEEGICAFTLTVKERDEREDKVVFETTFFS